MSLSRNIYLADRSNHCIRKITTAGVVTHFVGGTATGSSSGTLVCLALVIHRLIHIRFAGVANGVGTAATFNNPNSVAVDTNENVYIMDYFNNRVRVADTSGNVHLRHVHYDLLICGFVLRLA
jgi:hypothetical protein